MVEQNNKENIYFEIMSFRSQKAKENKGIECRRKAKIKCPEVANILVKIISQSSLILQTTLELKAENTIMRI